MLSDQAKATIAQGEAKRHAYLNNTGPLFDGRLGARTIGDLALLDVGCVIWARTDGTADQRLDHRGDARGGIILEVVDRPVHVDEDTGEIRQARAFRCFDLWKPGHLAISVLTEAQIDPHACEGPVSSELVRAVRRLGRTACQRDRGAWTKDEADALADAKRLSDVLMVSGQ